VGAACVNRHHWVIKAQWGARMKSTFGHRLSQVWVAIQDGLFPEIERQLGETLTPKLQQLIRTLEVARVEEHLSPIFDA
jgi:hypothetical protein